MPKVTYTDSKGKQKSKHFPYTKTGLAAAQKFAKAKKGKIKKKEKRYVA
jgi:hypothetical protein|tara:strand:+ start:238 stop:384 length:147 start_codon:yes stop_codon:yes gene_type:complete